MSHAASPVNMANDLHRPTSSIDGVAPVSLLSLVLTLVDDGCVVP